MLYRRKTIRAVFQSDCVVIPLLEDKAKCDKKNTQMKRNLFSHLGVPDDHVGSGTRHQVRLDNRKRKCLSKLTVYLVFCAFHSTLNEMDGGRALLGLFFTCKFEIILPRRFVFCLWLFRISISLVKIPF
jgi:hypothetical protein